MSSNITHTDLVIMRMNLIGGDMGSLVYGANLCVYIPAAYFLFNKSGPKERLHWVMVIFSTILFAGATTITGIGIKLNQMALIDSQFEPNGLSGTVQSFTSELLHNRLNLIQTWIYITTNFLADLLILLRLYWVWGGNLAIVAIPGLLFLTSTACSIMVVYQSTNKTWLVFSFAIPYFSLSVAVTIIATILITIRLMTGRQIVKRLLGRDHGTPYVSIIAMIVESAAIYSILGIFFIAFAVTDHPAQNVLSPMLGQAMCLAPNLIILRVAVAQSWYQGSCTKRIQFTSVPPSSFVDSQAPQSDQQGAQRYLAKGLDSSRTESEATLNISVV